MKNSVFLCSNDIDEGEIKNQKKKHFSLNHFCEKVDNRNKVNPQVTIGTKSSGGTNGTISANLSGI
ncbi:MAG TPA: hypothetical protein ENH29_10105 [Bacteroidetes bacterium]|nr:hypothetical protein [Bacteroidota bacterium]